MHLNHGKSIRNCLMDMRQSPNLQRYSSATFFKSDRDVLQFFRVLHKVGARDIHVRRVKRERGRTVFPFATIKPDPFRENHRAFSGSRASLPMSE